MRNRLSKPKRFFALVPNDAMRDRELSIEERGLLALLMTYDDAWEFKTGHLMKVAGCGRDKFQRIMRGLEVRGYIRREVIRGEGGKLEGSRWMINDSPNLNQAPDSQLVAAAESGETRQTVDPTIGKTAPIRRTKEKEKKIKELLPEKLAQTEGLDAAFKTFWEHFPKTRNSTKTRRLFEEAVAVGADSEVLVKAAKLYRSEKRDTPRKYICYSDNWLKDQRWRDSHDLEPPTKESSLTELAEFWAEKIKSGQYVPSSALRQATISEILHRKLASVEEIRAAGFSP